MSRIIHLWDKDKRYSVKASLIRTISISDTGKPDYRSAEVGDLPWEVKGWYNDDDYFFFGAFETEEEARDFVVGLHSRMALGH